MNAHSFANICQHFSRSFPLIVPIEAIGGTQRESAFCPLLGSSYQAKYPMRFYRNAYKILVYIPIIGMYCVACNKGN